MSGRDKSVFICSLDPGPACSDLLLLPFAPPSDAAYQALYCLHCGRPMCSIVGVDAEHLAPAFLASFSNLSPLNRIPPRFSSSNGLRRGRCASHSLPRVHHSLPRPSAYPFSVSTGSHLPFPSSSQTSNLLLQSRGVRIVRRFRKSEGGVYPTARACTFCVFWRWRCTFSRRWDVEH